MRFKNPCPPVPTLTSGLALSIEIILAQWEDMSKEKPDRATSSKKVPTQALSFG